MLITLLPLPHTEVTSEQARDRAREFCLAAFKTSDDLRSPGFDSAKVVFDDYTSPKWANPVWWVMLDEVECAVDARDGTVRAFERKPPMLGVFGSRAEKPPENIEALARAYSNLTGGSERWNFDSIQEGTYAHQPAFLLSLRGPEGGEGFMAIDSQSRRLLQLTRRAVAPSRSAPLLPKRLGAEVSEGEARIAAKHFAEAALEKHPFQPRFNLTSARLEREDSVTRAWTTPTWSLSFDWGSCAVDRKTAEIRRFWYRPPMKRNQTGRSSVREKLPKLVREYTRMAGSPYALAITGIDRDETPFPEYAVQLRYVQGEVSFPRYPGCDMRFDADTGMLLGLVLRKPLDLPVRKVSPIAPERALAAAISYSFSDRRRPEPTLFNLNPPSAVRVMKGPELTVWRPDREDSEEGRALLSPELKALGRAGKTILTYWVLLADAESFSPSHGTYARQYVAQVDAEKGDVVSFVQSQPMGRGNLSHVKAPPKPVVPPRLAKTKLELVRGASHTSVKASWAEGKQRIGKTTPVAIQMGSLYWRGLYDPVANVLAMGGDAAPVFVTPDPVLRAALARG